MVWMMHGIFFFPDPSVHQTECLILENFHHDLVCSYEPLESITTFLLSSSFNFFPPTFFDPFQIENMDALFEAQFSPLADSGRALSKCGKCLRYMKYISSQPSRLYCGTCEEVYYLPQNGTIKVKIIYLHEAIFIL